ncbi:HIT family protein [Candidatus Woesearchaeota archaeon]|nr:HIT family protein [Candidatus Woesearchaeota archaeon]
MQSSHMQEVDNAQQELLKQCLFCKIANKAIPSEIVFEDEHFTCVLDINPASTGHVLVIPKKHYSVSPQLPIQAIESLARIVKASSQAFLQGLGFKGFNMLISNGLLAGQRSPHLVIHLIPRQEYDSIRMPEPPDIGMLDVSEDLKKQVQASTPELKAVLEKLFQQVRVNASPAMSQSCALCNAINKKPFFKHSLVSVVEPNLAKGALLPSYFLIAPTTHYTIIQQTPLPVLSLALLSANLLSAMLFEIYAKQGIEVGTNIVLRNGIPAGQTLNHANIEVILRFKQDNNNFQWTGKQVSKDELSSTQETLSQAFQQAMQALNAESQARFQQEPRQSQLQSQAKQQLAMQQGMQQPAQQSQELPQTQKQLQSQEKPSKEQEHESNASKQRTPWHRIP